MFHLRKGLRGATISVLSAALIAGCAPSAVDPPTPAARSLPPVVFPRSVVHELPSASGRRYQLWVELPDAYGTTDRPFPVVFVTDPQWALPVVRSVRELVGRRGRNIEDFVLVGLSHDPALTSGESRARDYTPSNPRARAGYDPSDYDFAAYGEAQAYREYLETRALPFVADRYRVDMRRRTYVGHSYGGLFGAYLLLTRPGMFDGYILGSPSLWFDRHAILELEAERAARPGAVRGHVFMLTGENEAIRPENIAVKKHDLVADMLRFQEVLAGRGHPDLTISSEIADGEDHLTVYPDVVTRGLLTLLPGTEPYDGS